MITISDLGQKLENKVQEYPNHDFEVRLKRGFAVDEFGRVVECYQMLWEENARLRGRIRPLQNGLEIVTDTFLCGIFISEEYINSVVVIGPALYMR